MMAEKAIGIGVSIVGSIVIGLFTLVWFLIKKQISELAVAISALVHSNQRTITFMETQSITNTSLFTSIKDVSEDFKAFLKEYRYELKEMAHELHTLKTEHKMHHRIKEID